jgi:hypothetical protein
MIDKLMEWVMNWWIGWPINITKRCNKFVRCMALLFMFIWAMPAFFIGIGVLLILLVIQMFQEI